MVDRAGLPIVMLRGDGAGHHTPEGADRKAYTARTFGTSSADFVKRMLNERYGFVDYETMFWALDHSDEPREGMQAFMEKRSPNWIPPDLRS